MNKIEKALQQLSPKDRAVVKETILSIYKGNFEGFDLKKLKGKGGLYRVRKGKLRIIFTLKKEVKIVSIERRSDTTYNF